MDINKFCSDVADIWEAHKHEGDSFIVIAAQDDGNGNISVANAFQFYSRISVAASLYAFLQEALKVTTSVGDEIMRVKLEHLIEEAEEIDLIEGLNASKRIDPKGLN